MASSLEHIRHSFAHLLAAAITELYPSAKNTIGPAIDNGFYYDFEFTPDEMPSEKEFEKIEKTMRTILKTWKGFEGKEVNANEAKHLFEHNPYKLELINDIISKGELLTLYTSGSFTDLCRGGHANTSDMKPDAFKLSRIAGAYWKGDEKNKMLTRIYGLAFESKEKLNEYEVLIEEAKKRDHKKIGKEMGLIIFSDLVGPGLPHCTPRGTTIRELLNEYVWEMRKAQGYERVTIPHITKKDLYETSGHWKKYADDLFKIETREKHIYAMKPMNCPHHTQIYASELRSYRNLPQRYCETTMVYRDEQSGELSGLSRVLSITQDDAHVFCRENQIEQEVFIIWDIIDTFYKTFGFKDLTVRFSRHDPAHFEKYLGTKEMWAKAESSLKGLLDKRGVTAIDGIGESAFYGPKLDFIAKDSLGRVLQVATIQLDFNMPERFGLECTNEKGERERIVMIHCAIMGSIERFMSTLIEHTAGNFPLWLSPVQVKVVPVREHHNTHAEGVAKILRDAGLRIDCDTGEAGFGKKVREAKDMKIPYTIIIGDKDIEAGVVTLESRDKGKVGALSIEDVKNMLLAEHTEKK